MNETDFSTQTIYETELSPATSADKRLFFLLAIPILILDQVSKWWITTNLPLYSVRLFPSVDPYFKFSHVPNTGAAFGLFQGGKWVFTLLAIVVACAILYFNYELTTPNRKLRVALGLVFGGAVGNLIDRLRIGHVTDFLDFDVSSIINVPLADWAVFNVADTAIVAGVIVMTYLTLFEPEEIEPTRSISQEPAGDIQYE